MHRSFAAALWVALLIGSASAVSAQPLESAVLPASRSVEIGEPAAAFATVINGGSTALTDCTVAPGTALPATFSFQATNAGTNQAIGAPNAPFDIAVGSSRTFVFSLTPMAAVAATEVPLVFSCPGAASPAVLPGVNTLLFSAASTPIPDVNAVAVTASGNGVVTAVQSGGPAAFSVAALNAGTSGTLVASVDTGTSSLPVSLQICQTNSETGTCQQAVTPQVTLPLDANGVATFSVFVSATDSVPLDPGRNRVFFRFTDSNGQVRGSTSVAVAASCIPLNPASLPPGFQVDANGDIVEILQLAVYGNGPTQYTTDILPVTDPTRIPGWTPGTCTHL